MDTSESLFHQNECSLSATNEMKSRIISIMKFLRRDLRPDEEESLMQEDLPSIFPKLEQYLKDSFLMMVQTVCSSKKLSETFTAFTDDFENLFMIILEQLSTLKISYIIIPCISSIACMMYYVEETFSSSQDIIIQIFANYMQLRLHILDNVFKAMMLLQTQNLAGKCIEKIARSILLCMQSIAANLSVQSKNLTDDQVFEKAEQQIQSLTIHWISLFIGDIDSKVTNEHLPKLLNNFIRHVVKMLDFFKYPSAPYCLTVILRTLMSCLSSLRSTTQMKKLALEQICFIIINLKKMVNFSSCEENTRVVSNIHDYLKSSLQSFGNCVDVDICCKILLIRYMEKQYSDTDTTLSPIPFLRLNFLRFVDDTRNETTVDGSARKRKIDGSLNVTYNAQMRYYSHMRKFVSYELQRKDADIIYHYIVFSRSELRFLVDRYFQRVILITSVKNNSLRLSAVKQLVPLIEVNNELLLSRILKIAIRSLILDHSVYVRENILITLGKIVLLYQPHTYVAIFEENFENISSRVLDVHVGVRKAVIHLFKNFCSKNRNHEKVMEILSCILSRIQDQNESVRFEAVEILKQLWFTQPESSSTYSVLEIVHLSIKCLNNLIQLFNNIFLINQQNPSVSLFEMCKNILTYVAQDRSKFPGEDLDKLEMFIAKVSPNLTKENANYITTYMNEFIRPEIKKNTSNLK